MSLFGNLLWLLLGGFFCGIAWFIAGLLCCITIIGIPLGVQCFKFAKLAFFPFGKEIIYSESHGSLLLNVIWLLILGWENAIACFIAGIVLTLTIIGIPFGKQFFKFGKLWLMPFGAKIAY